MYHNGMSSCVVRNLPFCSETRDIYLHGCALSFFVRCSETARILLPVKFLTPNLKSPWAISYSNFGGTFAKIYRAGFTPSGPPVQKKMRGP